MSCRRPLERPSCIEGGPRRSNSGKAGPEDLGIRRRGFGRVYPVSRCPAGLRCVRGNTSKIATTGPGGSDAMETLRPNKFY